jgi:excinuclease UvrABC nuclease subunit
MKVDLLFPPPSKCETFKRDRERFVPEIPGCYVLASFAREVLYVGLTDNLRRRMNEHLDTSQKTRPTKFGRAMHFFWHECQEPRLIERTWLNTHIQHEGVRPILNKVDSPITI